MSPVSFILCNFITKRCNGTVQFVFRSVRISRIESGLLKCVVYSFARDFITPASVIMPLAAIGKGPMLDLHRSSPNVYAKYRNRNLNGELVGTHKSVTSTLSTKRTVSCLAIVLFYCFYTQNLKSIGCSKDCFCKAINQTI